MPYEDQNIAVLGAGLSGTAAALLLKAEGARITVLDSAEEKICSNRRSIICGKQGFA